MSLKENDLHDLIEHIFEVDSYASKMGNDKDIVVLSFTVEDKEPAEDLVNFVERGYDFVLDADASPGELDDGKYKVFVELERTKRVAEQIQEIMYGLSNLTGNKDFKFRYYKSFNSLPLDNLNEMIPTSPNDYEIKIKENSLNNFSNFFNKSYLESISVDNDDLVFQKKYAEPLRMRIKGFGSRSEVYESLPGRIMIENKDIAESLYLTKYIGNYNITKINQTFVFENGNFAVALEKL
jgi:hypothetical protein